MDHLLKRMSQVLAGFACVVLLLIMVLTFVDVLGRYFFDAPVSFSVELIKLGMGLLVLFGLAITTLERGHIAVDIAETLVPVAARRVLTVIAALSGVMFITLMAWRLWDRAVKFLGDGLATDVLFLPVWPVVMLMAFAAGVAAIVACMQLLRPASRSNTQRPD